MVRQRWKKYSKYRCYKHKRGNTGQRNGPCDEFYCLSITASSILVLFQLSSEAEKIELLNTSHQTKQLSSMLPTEGWASDSTAMSEPDKSTKCWKENKSVGLIHKRSGATNRSREVKDVGVLYDCLLLVHWETIQSKVL